MTAPTVALTFDDGPSDWTEDLLDVLADADAHATFFVLGCHIRGREHLLVRAHQEGHELGVHSWNHPRPSQLSAHAFVSEMLDTAAELARVTGQETRLWRPPWHHAREEAEATLASLGYRRVGVTVDAHDVSVGTTLILERIRAGLEEGAIVGLHDGIAPNGQKIVTDRTATVDAVEEILRSCRSVTVSELAGGHGRL